MKKSTIITWIVIILILAGISFGAYQYYFKEDSKSTLTLVEKQWIESNKNKIIDFGIVNDIEVFTSEGKGLVFDFIMDLEEDTKLEFNKIPVSKKEQAKTDYRFEVVEKADKNDILVYQDHYVLLQNEKKEYHNINDITNLKVGVLKKDLEKVDHYLIDRNKLAFQTYSTVEEMIVAVEKKEVNAIVLPEMYFLKEITGNKNLNIVYNMNDITLDYVISLGNTNKLNTILRKYFKKWSKEEYRDSFNDNFSSTYLKLYGIDEQTASEFKSKTYTYGFINNRPYHVMIEDKIYGYTPKQLSNFAKMADIEIEYKNYKTLNEMQTAFNENKIDLFYNDAKNKKYQIDVYETTSLFSDRMAIASPYRYDLAINSLNSLKGMEVATLKDSKLEELVKKAGAKVKSYDTVEKLVDSKSDIIALDYYTYEYYKTNILSNYKLDYTTTIESNGYLIRDIKANRVFENFLDFYIKIVGETSSVYDHIYMLNQLGNKPIIFKKLLYIGSFILIIILGYFGIKKYKQIKNNVSSVSKMDKLRYIDSLTSLKNRTYLNEHVEAWDDSEVYPQAIIIVDLNNIAYINDNYGHQEGDTVIKEAANKLITTQIENSEIIRTNGNEFLIYLVGYDEKQVVTYIRKLTKEMKDLSHGYGAAVGYSMIQDAIKTIDDAVNEATLDMRSNKEELNN